MAWKMYVGDQGRVNAVRELNQASKPFLKGGFEWERSPSGDCTKLSFMILNSAALIAPRSAIELFIDDVPVFYGIAVDVPNPASLHFESVTVIGGREVLRGVLMDSARYVNVGALAIMRDILARLCPLSLYYRAEAIGDGSATDVGPLVGELYRPLIALDVVLDDLARLIGWPVIVDAQAVIYCRPPVAPLVVAFDSQPWGRLPIDARETVTRAVLTVVGNVTTADDLTTIAQAAPVPAPAPLPGSIRYPKEYRPRPYTVQVDDLAHPRMNMTKVVAPPDGVSLTKKYQTGVDGAYTAGFGSVAGMNDGSLDSYAEANTNGYVSFRMSVAAAGIGAENQPVGATIRYSLGEGFSQNYFVFSVVLVGSGGDRVRTSLRLSATEAATGRALLILPNYDSTDWAEAYIELTTVQNADETARLRLYDVALLLPNVEGAVQYARTFLNPPFATPSVIELPTIVDPSPVVRVTGSPDGTVEGMATSYAYSHSTGKLRKTIVKIGAQGDDALTKAIKWRVQNGVSTAFN